MNASNESFSDLGLHKNLLDTLNELGFEHPTPIQAKSIPIALQHKDMLGCAQTGTGKTLAFCLPLLHHLQNHPESQALILSPTREIAQQTHEVLETFGTKHGLNSVIIIGGQSIGKQIQDLKNSPRIFVATPGRLLDHVERRNISLKNMNYVILDEADHMLDLGFLPQVREILSGVPEKRQTMMFSATFPNSIASLAKTYLKNPERIEVAAPGTAAEGVEHCLYLLEPEDKRRAILKLLEGAQESTLIFTRTKLDAEWLYRLLSKQGVGIHALHSNRSQKERTDTLKKFKADEFPILVATDILARGIDISDIAHVINYDIPQNPDDYIHRVGRTGRANAKGKASTLATWLEKSFIDSIEKQLERKIPRAQLEGIAPAAENLPRMSNNRRGGKRVRLR